ncbi:MAG: hypothetical protein ACRD9R_08930 [Pyrinomonadaceae bacterium]
MAHYRTSLGKKSSNAYRALRDNARRLCVVCGEWRDWALFKPRKRKARGLNLHCSFCDGRTPAHVRHTLHPPMSPLKEHLRANVKFLYRLFERRISKGRGTQGMSAEELSLKVAKFPDRIAAIIGKTYAEQGDQAKLADDTAVMMIRDLLIELDETLIERNKNKRLANR